MLKCYAFPAKWLKRRYEDQGAGSSMCFSYGIREGRRTLPLTISMSEEVDPDTVLQQVNSDVFLIVPISYRGRVGGGGHECIMLVLRLDIRGQRYERVGTAI